MSSTNGSGLASPSTFIIRPRPASRIAHTCRCSVGSSKIVTAYAAVSCVIELPKASSLDRVSETFSPVISTTRMSEGSSCKNPRLRENPSDFRAWLMMISPICSTALTSCSSVATVASMVSRNVRKCRTANPFDFGMSQSFNRASVTAASVPSEPTITCVRSMMGPSVTGE